MNVESTGPLPASGDTVELAITSVSSDGRGVGRYKGLTFFCEGAIPGQTVLARTISRKKRFAEAQLVDILQHSPDEREPLCPHADACGGCPWQTASETAALRWKEAIVRDALARIGHIAAPPVRPIIPSPQMTGYRNKMAFVFGTDASGRTALGQKSRRSHHVTNILTCPMQDEGTGRILSVIRAVAGQSGLGAGPAGYWRHLIIRKTSSGRKTIELIINKNNGIADIALQALHEAMVADPAITGACVSTKSGASDVAAADRVIKTIGMTELTETLHRNPGHFPEGTPAELTLAFPHDAFFQVNTPAAEILYNQAASMLDCHDADDLWDLYCGVGGIGLFLKPLAKTLFGVETSRPAIAYAKRNAQAAGCADALFTAGDASLAIKRMGTHELTGRSLVVIDPPRAGLSKDIVTGLLRHRPGRIIYMSCNPATLARDLEILKQRFNIETAQPVDLFPQTPHVETVCLLVLRNPVTHVNIDVDVEELVQDKRGQATYEQIREYVKEQTGLYVTNLNIAQTKRKCGIIERENYNLPKSEDSRQPNCTKEKEDAIKEAFRHFGMIT